MVQAGLKKEIKLPEFLQFKFVTLKQLSVFTRQLSTLIHAGLPLVRALYTLTDQLDGYLKEVVSKITTQVEAGDKFSACLGRYPEIFPNVFVSMIKAAELGGMMDEVLKKLAGFLEKDEKLKSKVRSALMYPGFVLAVAIIILTLLMVFVVPTFSNMFADLGGELPMLTQILINISDAIRYHWYWLILGLGVLGFGFRVLVLGGGSPSSSLSLVPKSSSGSPGTPGWLPWDTTWGLRGATSWGGVSGIPAFGVARRVTRV